MAEEETSIENYGMYIGINGLGRIGKCIFIQLLKEKVCRVKAINIPGFDIRNIETYLTYDSTHKAIDFKYSIKIIDETTFSINRGYGEMVIHVLDERDPAKLNWRKYGVDYVIDSTGAFLTEDKCVKHNVDYVIMCAPPKDNTSQFVYNVNHEKYRGEKIVSNASCTTNCLTPVLRVLEDVYGVEKASFTTIHSTTASQNTIDTNNFKNRTSRSILNNIIPHSTGANKSVSALIPTLKDKISGTSLRVPVNNVSIVDLTITLKAHQTLSKEEVLETLEKSGFIEMCKQNRVSSDYNTTTCPSIVDYNASMALTGKNEFKLMIWYDNEWSYCAQVIKLGMYMARYNELHNNGKNNCFIGNSTLPKFANRRVVLRVDWNVPIQDGVIQDFYRVTSSMKTINKILSDKPEKLIIISHLGRPEEAKSFQENSGSTFSWSKYISQLQPYFQHNLHFLSEGLSPKTLSEINSSDDTLYLLENIRFHPEETKFSKLTEDQRKENMTIKCFNGLGDYYVNDAFGCCHRNHMSIVGANLQDKAYGYLINKEVSCLQMIADNKNNDRILAIIGGGKMKDKLELLKKLSCKVDGIYIGGGNVNSLYYDDDYNSYLDELHKNKAKIYLMNDGLAATDLESQPSYKQYDSARRLVKSIDADDPTTSIDLDETSPGSKKLFFDIGMQSIIELNNLIQNYDTIFWNGTLGVVENKMYACGSTTLLNMLMTSGKKVIIGGGDTACFCNRFPHNFHFVSTGGGASIDYISNGALTGINYFQN